MATSGGKQWIETTGAVEAPKVVETADVGFANVDLRYGAAASLLDHGFTQPRLQITRIFLDVGHTPLALSNHSAWMQ